jgi:cytochrome c-type biogenesis protein CcmH/NrfG
MLADATDSAAATDSGSPVLSILFWAMVVIAAVVAAYFIIMRLKAWLSNESDTESMPIGFTLSDLRRLHADGKMSDEEFEKAKAKMIEATKKAAEKAAQAAKKPTAGPDFPDLKL